MPEPVSDPIRPPGRVLPCSGRAVLIGTLCAALFVCLSWRPLWHTDLWGHLDYGGYIVSLGRVPHKQPFLIFTAREEFIDTAWLSQVIGYQAYEALGVGGLQWLYGASITLCALLLCGGLISRTRSLLWSVAGAVLFLYVDWQQLLIVRPQLAGLICYIALFIRLNGRHRRVDWFFVPLLFFLWANLHGSFVMGWGLIGAYAFGRFFDERFRPTEMDHQSEPRRWPALCGLLLLAIAATLLNPYGMALHREIWDVAHNPNLADLIEWQPLLTHKHQSIAFFVAAGALGSVLVANVMIRRVGGNTARVVPCAELVLLGGLGAATILTSRFILWWGPVAGWCFARQGSACWRAAWEDRSLSTLERRSWSRTVAMFGVLLAAVAFTPLGQAIMAGKPLDFATCVSEQTPIGATEYLFHENPDGIVFNSYEWGDYLHWDGGLNMIYITSHAHLVPPQLWKEYLSVSRAEPGWDTYLEKRFIRYVVIDPYRQSRLVAALRKHPDWKAAYEDDRSIVFQRPKPEESEPRASP